MKKKREKTSLNDSLNKILYGKNYKEKQKGANNASETVQDLLSYEEITNKGVVVADNAFSVMIEVGQLNSNLLDFVERSSVWTNFRTLLNSINVRYSLILQSHFYDVRDFVNTYEHHSRQLTNLTPQLLEAREDVLHYYRKFSEERNREQRGYIIFRYNPKLEGIETNLSTGNATLDSLFNKMKSNSTKTDAEEDRNIATSVLEEVADLAYNLLFTIGCPSIRLNKEGVLKYMFSVLQRDLSINQRISDAYRDEVFNGEKISDTPSFISKGLEQIMSEQEFEEFYVNSQTVIEETANTNEELFALEQAALDIINSGVSNGEINTPIQDAQLENTQQTSVEPPVIEELSIEPSPIISTNNNVVDINDGAAVVSKSKLARQRKKERIKAMKEEAEKNNPTKNIQ